MRSLIRYKISVRAQACLLLGMTVVWVVFTFDWKIAPSIETYWGAVCSLIPYANLVLGLFLWRSYSKGGWLHPWLVRAALIAAISPWLLMLGFMFEPAY